MFTKPQIRRASSVIYRQRPPVKVIHPGTLPIMNRYDNQKYGDKNLGIILEVASIVVSLAYSAYSWWSSSKKKKKAKKKAAAYAAMLQAEAQRLVEEEARLAEEKRKTEALLRETETRVESARTELLKYKYPHPPIYSWGERAEGKTTTGGLLVAGSNMYKK